MTRSGAAADTHGGPHTEGQGNNHLRDARVVLDDGREECERRAGARRVGQLLLGGGKR